MILHPHFLANRGRLARLARTDPERHRAICVRGAKQSLTWRRGVVASHVVGLSPLRAYQRGYRAGYKCAWLRWKVWAQREIQRATRRAS